VFRVDGLEITKSSNTISDVLTGVAFTLAKADNYASTATLTIDKDTSSLKAKVSAFVNAYNSLNTQIKALRGNVNSKGALSGEPVLLSLGNAVRGITSATFADNQLSNLGISLDKSGVMSLDSAKLDAAISADSSAVVATLNAMGASVETNLNAYVTDVLPSRQKGLQETVKTIQKSEELMQNRLLQIQSRLQKQYSKLDTLLQQLQGTSNYVTQAMTQITNQFKKT
jgi:flagellar hook-associated protein 2